MPDDGVGAGTDTRWITTWIGRSGGATGAEGAWGATSGSTVVSLAPDASSPNSVTSPNMVPAPTLAAAIRLPFATWRRRRRPAFDGGVGVAGLLLGGNYLDYFVLAHDSVHGQERGIFWVEVGVAVTVSGVMLKIFYMFADRRKGELS